MELIMTEEDFFDLCLTMLDVDGVTPPGVIARDVGNHYLITILGTQRVAALFSYGPDDEITCHSLGAEPIGNGRWVPIYGLNLSEEVEPGAEDRPNLIRKSQTGLELSCRGSDGCVWWLPIPDGTIPDEGLEDNGEIGKRYSSWEISCMAAGNASGLMLRSPGHPESLWLENLRNRSTN